MTDEFNQDAADRRVSALIAEMLEQGFTVQHVWMACMSQGAGLGRRDIGHKELARRLRMLAHDITTQVVQTPQRQHRSMPAPSRWRTWPLQGEESEA